MGLDTRYQLRMRFLRGVEAFLSQFNVKTPKGAKDAKGVKGQFLLVCPLWLQTYALIVHRSIEIYYCKYITYDVLLIFPRFFDTKRWEILLALCYRNSLHEIIKIHDRFGWSNNDVRRDDNFVFMCACTGNYLDLAKWLYTTFQLTVDDIRSNNNATFHAVCIYGHLDVAKWLYTVFQLTVEDARSQNNFVFMLASDNDHEDVCDWLVATFGESVKA